jgi:hypothetical protein
VIGKQSVLAPIRSRKRWTQEVVPASSLAGSAAQCIQSENDLPGLAPQERLVPVEPIERIGWVFGKFKKAQSRIAGAILI